ncbi:MAG TPA: hypothetical protein VJ553_02655 [Candidatus Paceibacterota bacterium]|nr:hypothetical protein [Candidatus Paceibacterota bacterium]
MDQEPKTARDVMEEAKRELEEQAKVARQNAGQNPMVPDTDLDEDDIVPMHEIPLPQPTPQQVIEEEHLGVE